MTEQEQYVLRVLDLTQRAAVTHLLTWSVRHTTAQARTVLFFLDCSGLFGGPHPDVQGLEPALVGKLERACADVRDADPGAPLDWAVYLFIARLRRSRPVRAAYPVEHERLWRLFNLAGPRLPGQLDIDDAWPESFADLPLSQVTRPGDIPTQRPR